MTISSNDSLMIATALGVCYQMHVPPEQILKKSDEDLRSIICMLKGEGLKVEMLACFKELFPEGLTVKRDRATGLPVVNRGKG